MKKISLILIGVLHLTKTLWAQDTFSIVAVDTATKEVGSAGASCVDLFVFLKEPDFIGELVPGKGAINTQASYNEFNQGNAFQRMEEDSSPQAIIDWLANNDVGNTPAIRQYGIASLAKGTAKTAGYTGTNCLNWKGHKAGYNYCIQGNILLGPEVLDSMESRFLNEKGDLKTKLMAAMQGAKMIGADTRCAPNNSSTLFAYLKVAKPTDIDGANPSFRIMVKTKMNDKIEPIDSLQKLFNKKIAVSSVQSAEASEVEIINSIQDITMKNIFEYKIRTKVFSMAGEKMNESSILPNESQSINCANWAQGVYILQLLEENGVVIKTIKLKH